MTLGFLYGAGAETLILVTGTSGKSPNIFVSRQKNQVSCVDPDHQEKIGFWAAGAEIQTSAVDTRTAVWVSTAEKFFKIILGETRNFSRMFRRVSAPALYKNPAVTLVNEGKIPVSPSMLQRECEHVLLQHLASQHMNLSKTLSSPPSSSIEPLNAPCLFGLFSRRFSRGKTAH